VSDETERSTLRWWQYIGPWPIRALPLSIITAFLFSFTVLGAAVLETQGIANFTGWVQVPSILLGTLVLWLVLEAGSRYQRRSGMGIVPYLLVMYVAATAALIVRTVGGGVSEIMFSSVGSFFTSATRLWIPLMVLSTIWGVTTSRLQAQVEQTKAALALTRVQQDWMLEADERARRQVADTLHDRVQASLIAACMNLQHLDPQDPHAVDRVIQRLEELRKVDVRRAARALSPTLSEVGLASSLAELAIQYEPAMITVIRVDPRASGSGSVDERTRLGIYRIIEQALLNSAGHGGASNATVTVTCTTEGIEVSVEDDGSGLGSAEPASGSGSALISTWVRTLGGTWAWGDATPRGLVVRAWLPGHMCDDSPSPSSE